jgi:hypothetical protein
MTKIISVSCTQNSKPLNFSPCVHSTNISYTILITASTGDAKRDISLALKTPDHPVKPVSEKYPPLSANQTSTRAC